MLHKLIFSASVATLLLAAPAFAQSNSSGEVLIPKKNKQQTEQGQQAPGKNADQQTTGSASGTQQQDSQQATEGTAAKKKKQSDQASGASGTQQTDQAAGSSDTQQSGSSAKQATGDQNSTTDKQQKNAAGTSQQQDNQATGSTTKPADITVEKRTEIRKKLVSTSVTKVDRSKVDFQINVGVAVPSTIELHPLPAEVVQIVPAYQGYDYFVLADGTIIIVEPSSHHIVFVLAA